MNKMSLHTEVKNIFESKYFEIKDERYYWTAKDAANCKQLINKVKFIIKSREKPLTDENVINSVAHLIELTNGWVRDNLSMSILNSKFNEIIANGKGNNKKTANRRIDQESVSKNRWQSFVEGVRNKHSI
jgi:hypothetical protein